jgi:serine/threonine protein kinase
MHHPALPRVSDHFAEGEGQFLVMQFIPGDDLSQMIARRQGPFPAEQVLTWGDQLLDALDYLHTQDPPIIHRDIKPQNLKLTGRGQIILLDFGLAKGQGAGLSVVTTSASIYGYTPNYAPLEQIQGLGTDVRSDIYALGATLYHLMTGVKPPDALTRAAALVNGQPDPLTPANEINSNIKREVAAVLARAMSQNRDQRYPTAAAMRATMSGGGEVETLVGKTEAATVILERPATTLIDESTSEQKTALKGGETTVVRPTETPRKRRVSPWAIGVAALILVGVLFGAFYAFQRRNNSTANTAPSSLSVQGNENTSNATQSPSPIHGSNEPSSGEVVEVKKAVTGNQPAPVAESAKKVERTAKKSEKAKEKQPTDDEDELITNPGQQYPDVNVTPTIPDVSDRTGRRNLRRYGAPTIRNLPDGRQIMTFPDGTRIVTRPNGTKKVFGPGQRMPERPNQP